MDKSILEFPKQFTWQPSLKSGHLPVNFNRFVLFGMGGSHLNADLLKTFNPSFDLTIHSDYGLPALSDLDLVKSFFIASSFSGNTEEVLENARLAQKRELPLACLSTGGALLKMASDYNWPFVKLPKKNIQPRMALGYTTKALAFLTGQKKILKNLTNLAQKLKPANLEKDGVGLAETLKGYVPIIYASTRNCALAKIWKIKFNETGKVPAFYNILPELNHNEMTGFDVATATRELSAKFYFIFLTDQNDQAKNKKRMQVLAQFYQEKGLKVKILDLPVTDRFDQVFSNILLADWAAYYLAISYNLEPEQVPMVEKFKKMIA